MKEMFWKLCGSIADSDWLPNFIAAGYPRVRRLMGETAAARFRHYPVSLLRLPFPRYGLTDNLHCLGLDARIDYLLNSVGAVPKRSPLPWDGKRSLRIGFVGALAANLSTPPSMFEAFPSDHELFIYDIALWGTHYLRFPPGTATSVKHFKLNGDYENNVNRLGGAINDDQLDILFIAHHDHWQRRDIIDLVDTPCIINFSTGSVLSYHQKVDVTVFVQPRKDFFVKNGRVHSVYTGSKLRGEPCWEGASIFDAKAVDPKKNPAWRDRRPHIFFHGRLHKLDSESFLESMGSLLRESSDVRFVFAGAGNEMAARVLSFFQRRGLQSQVSYLGEITHDHGGKCAGWRKILENLRQARLSPNTWPIGGGSARLEAYVAGTPQVHLGMNAGQGNLFDTTNQTVVDVPNLNTKLGTANGIEEYGIFCRRCLFDREYAEALVKEQYTKALRCTDSAYWWNEKINFYEGWLNDRENRA